jgi:hypothetical protein
VILLKITHQEAKLNIGHPQKCRVGPEVFGRKMVKVVMLYHQLGGDTYLQIKICFGGSHPTVEDLYRVVDHLPFYLRPMAKVDGTIEIYGPDVRSRFCRWAQYNKLDLRPED